MKKNNMRKVDFLWQTVSYTWIAYSMYIVILFVPLNKLGYLQSMIILAATVFLGAAAGTMLTFQYERNHSSMFCNMILAFSPYCIVSRWKLDRIILETAMLVVLISMVLLGGLTSILYFREDKKDVWSPGKWITIWLLRSRKLAAWLLSAAFMISASKTLLTKPIEAVGQTTLSMQQEECMSLSERMHEKRETLVLLEEAAWNDLDHGQKLSVLKTISDVEAAYLGIPPIEVRAKPQNASLLGSYNSAENVIMINLNHLISKKPRDLLKTVCHETYHAYQHRLVDVYTSLTEEAKSLLLFSDAAQYEAEFQDYKSGALNYEEYSAQKCEIASNAYAEQAAARYDLFLEEITRTENEQPIPIA